MASEFDQGIQDFENDQSMPDRVFPSLRLALRPVNLLQFMFGMLESWVLTRAYGRMLAGIPFLLVAGLGVGCYVWVRHSSIEPVLQKYHVRFDKAVKEKNQELEETCLRALCSLRPSVPEYRMRLGLYFFERGDKEQALYEIARLAPENTIGHPVARLWLVQQATGPEPLVKMTREEVENQLKKVLDADPRQVDAHQMLAALYLGRQELRQAELHLEEAAKVRPQFNLQLAQLKRQMKRPGDDAEAAAAKAVTELSRLLEQDRTRIDLRLDLANALLLTENYNQAREIILSGLLQKDEPRLRDALVDLDLLAVDRQLRSSVLNRDGCVPVVLNALRISPGNSGCITALSLLRSLGAEIPPEPLQPGLEYWQKQQDADPDASEPRLFVSELLFLSGEKVRAVENLRPAVSKYPTLRLTMARLLMGAGDEAGGRKLLFDLLRDSAKRLVEDPGNLLTILERAEAMLLLKRPDDVRLMIQEFTGASGSGRSLREETAVMDLYGRACLMKFDELTGYSAESVKQATSPEQLQFHDVSSNEIVPLAVEAAEISGSAFGAIERLSRLSLSNHAAARYADEALRKLRLEGQSGVIALNLLGDHARIMQNYEKAIFWLEQANSTAAGRNPMVLNNLALTTIRGRPQDAETALRYAHETLALVPGNSDALAARGEIHLVMKNYKDALADLIESLRNRGGSVEVHRLLEKAYLGLGDERMAHEHAKRATELATGATSS
ncbi:MAG: tetratricopeptide repeat protein [Planctomycetota bacterium]